MGLAVDGDKLLLLLLEYMNHKTVYYENDIIQLHNNVTYRKADPVDHLEMIMARVRLETAQMLFRDIYRLIRMTYT